MCWCVVVSSMIMFLFRPGLLRRGLRFLTTDSAPSSFPSWYVATQNQRTLKALDATVAVECRDDILAASSWTRLGSLPEVGPTGRYHYTTETTPHGHWRCTVSESDHAWVLLEIDLREHQLLSMSLSVDETLVAFVLEETLVHLGRVRSGQEAVQTLRPPRPVATVEWGPRLENGTHCLYITTVNELHRPDTVWVCSVHESSFIISEWTKLYSNLHDESVRVSVQRTKGCHYVAISASTKTSNEIYLIHNPSQPLLLVRPRQAHVQYYVDVAPEGNVFLLASRDTEELSLFATHVNDLPLKTGSSFGTLLTRSTHDYAIHDMDLFRHDLVLYERSRWNGSHRIRMLHQQNLMEVPLQLTPGTNLHYDATSFSWTVSSPVQPPVTHQYHFRNQTWTQQDQHHNDECTVRYSTWTATSRDGTLVPMTMIHDIHTDPAHHERPVLLLGYGAYGEPCLKPEYDPTLVPLVKRHGMVLAYAHTRGGGELGRAWYHAGRKYHKQNAIDDYLACAEMLLEKVEPRQLSARAFSAGGAVVAAAVNQRPTLFGSAVYVNAFLDVMTSMADPTLALTEHEYDEWGDPLRDKVAAETIMSYCPMTNIQPNTQYPPTLLICALDDVNVPYWHSLAFHAKILETTQSTDQFVYVAEQGGHHLHGTSLDMFSIVNTFLLKYNAPKSLEVK